MTNTLATPEVRPARPEFSSGPCAKRPGWTPENLKDAVLGRLHRIAIAHPGVDANQAGQ
eukprot:gene22621-22608_t